VKDIYNSCNKFGRGVGLNRENYILFSCDIFWKKYIWNLALTKAKSFIIIIFLTYPTQEGDSKVVY
jgi:hypothetical protein